MTPAERLIERLRQRGFAVPPDAIVLRTYAGHWQRSQGVWSWSLTCDRIARDARGYQTFEPYVSPWEEFYRSVFLGSQYPVTKLLRCRHDWQIDEPYEFGSPDRSISPCAQCE